MNIWRPIDAIADWVQSISIRSQERFAVLCILASFGLFFYAPFSNEPLLIYIMSAWALTIGGISGLWALEAQRSAEKNNGNGDE